MLAKKTNSYLHDLMKKSNAVKKQFQYCEQENQTGKTNEINPFAETSYEPVKNLIHKYSNRVLILFTKNCAAYCRFCTRRRVVSQKENAIDVDKMVDYIRSHSNIDEVIFSGGDPLTKPLELIEAMYKFAEIEHIKIIRIHTRVPVTAPDLFDDNILEAIKSIGKTKPVYISLHTNHIDELGEKTTKIIQQLRGAGAILISQSVFLKGVNDDVPTLANLFTKLTQLGVKPYYIHRCDFVKGVEHWIIPIEREVEIMTQLRKEISGLAYPLHVIDAPGGSGKIPVPTNFWEHNLDQFSDFNNKEIKMYGQRIKK